VNGSQSCRLTNPDMDIDNVLCGGSSPPPGATIIKSGTVQKGDWFYIQDLKAWSIVPEIAHGEDIQHATVARYTNNLDAN
jgi:hypothetical protein